MCEEDLKVWRGSISLSLGPFAQNQHHIGVTWKAFLDRDAANPGVTPCIRWFFMERVAMPLFNLITLTIHRTDGGGDRRLLSRRHSRYLLHPFEMSRSGLEVGEQIKHRGRSEMAAAQAEDERGSKTSGRGFAVLFREVGPGAGTII